jgi:hypothetical protein
MSKVIWEEGKYGFTYGHILLGGRMVEVFSIGWTSLGNYTLHSTLPGLLSRGKGFESQDAAKTEADKVLAFFAKAISE